MALRIYQYAAVVAMVAVGACVSARSDTDDEPTWRGEVGDLFRARCAECHAGSAPAAGWRAETHAGAVACVASGRSAIAGGAEAPILAALARPDHAGLVSEDERRTIERWLAAGAPSIRDGTHPPSFGDPRSPESHGNFLRSRGYRPMLSADDDDACGKCHDGVVVKPAGLAFSAPGATACTTCHDEPGGTLGCGTCHGAPGRLYPPRDPCFHPEAEGDRAHPVHAGPSASRAEGLPCSACHPQPLAGQMAGTHANGYLEVWFDYDLAGRAATFDPIWKTCTGTCHARGGARPEPAWSDAPMRCNDCHGSPPPNHYRGSCTSCHAEANAVATALFSPTLHVNGRVDLGDGSGRCGACHGEGDSPWPASGAHAAHQAPGNAAPVACATCHDVPAPGERHPIGRDAAAVRLAGLAIAGGRRASFDPATRTCAETYCHAGRAASAPSPRWTDGLSARACGACHATPPPAPHPPSSACDTCHATSSATTHVDGIVTR